jgi:hypothetical protein
MSSYAYMLVLLLLSGCGGFRGGIESVPYVGGVEPQQNSPTHSWPHEIRLPGLTLHLSLNNTVRTYQYEVMLYVIPTYLNLSNEFQHHDAENFEIALQATAHDSAITIDPRQLVLTMDDKEFYPVAVWVNNMERERQVIDAYLKARHQTAPDTPPQPPRSSEWRDAITAPVTILPGEKSSRFIVMFPVPTPSPERTLSLNLGPAIGESMPPDKSHIRFKPMRWSEGYS